MTHANIRTQAAFHYEEYVGIYAIRPLHRYSSRRDESKTIFLRGNYQMQGRLSMIKIGELNATHQDAYHTKGIQLLN